MEMTPDYDQLQSRLDDEAYVLYTVRELAEEAINALGPFSPPRIQPTDIRIFFETSSAPHIRSWFVTIRHGDRFVVRVAFDSGSDHWNAQVAHWEATPYGLYYIKKPVITTAESAPALIEAIFHSQANNKGTPIGHDSLVGATNEPVSQAVFWLYNRGSPGDALRRRIAGNYVLHERRFHLLPNKVAITWHTTQRS